MSFNYSKIGTRNATINQDDFDKSQEHGQSMMWIKAYDKLQYLRWPSAFFLLLSILVCQILIFRSQPASMPIGGELNNLVPHFSQEQKIFRADERYASDHKTIESVNATKKHWNDLMPRGGGFIEVSDHNSYILPPPMLFDWKPDQPLYSIAIFHEMHCLMHMAGYIDKLVMQIRNKDFTLNEGQIGHNDHCVNYLRNAIMCCGDTTLEGQSQAEMFKDVPGTDGTGAVHVCRNYDEISAWAEKRRVTGGKEIL